MCASYTAIDNLHSSVLFSWLGQLQVLDNFLLRQCKLPTTCLTSINSAPVHGHTNVHLDIIIKLLILTLLHHIAN